MNQMTRTLTFVIAAALSVLAAVAAHVMTKPPVLEGYTLVGQQFYPDFQEPEKATAIRIAAWNKKTSRVEHFEVRKEGKEWRIPSHYNYPADGEQQLARAAASATGIVRGSKVSDSPDTYERMGVVDPDDSSATQGPDSTGTRITLYRGDEILADFIIGKARGAAEEAKEEATDETSGKQEKEGVHYVRAPKEKQVYLAEVKIDVSTKFADWIQKDLLDLNSSDLREIVIDRYSINDKGEVVPGTVSELDRQSSSSPWSLKDLDAAKEKIKTSVVSAMARALDDLKIVGVRPKPKGLSAQLKGAEGAGLDMRGMLDLQDKGFFLTRGGELLSDEGQISAGTSDGVLYALRFGEVFTGSDLEIEVGAPAKTDESAAKTEGAKTEPAKDAANPEGDTAGDQGTAGDQPDADPAAGEQPVKDAAGDPAESGETADGKKPGQTSSRYVFVTVQFEPKLLGEPPVEPTKPEAPAGATPATAPAAPANDAAPKPAASDGPATKPEENSTPMTEGGTECGGQEEPAAPAAGEAPATPPTDEAVPAAAPEVTPPAQAPPAKTPQQQHEEDLEKYNEDLEAYKVRKQDYDKRVADGRRRVDELNKRFADWYYVIPADIFEDLKVKREDLVEPVEPPKEDAATTPMGSTNPLLPEETPAAPSTAPGTTVPETESTPAGATAPASPSNPDAPSTPATPADSSAAPTTPPADGASSTPIEVESSPAPPPGATPAETPAPTNPQAQPASPNS